MLAGLTGNFGTGKSEVLKIFSSLGAVTVDSDEIVRSLYENKEIQGEVLDILGGGIMRNGRIDKKSISHIIFNNKELKTKLEALLHGYVFSEIEELISKNRDKIVVAEIPLLYESGKENSVDVAIVTYCDEKTIYDRLRKKGFEEDEIRKRLSAQIPSDEKKKRADYVINTDMDLIDIKAAVQRIYDELRNLLPS